LLRFMGIGSPLPLGFRSKDGNRYIDEARSISADYGGNEVNCQVFIEWKR
jgi:hypothetical protein